MHKVGDQQTIQFRTFEQLRGDYDVVFNDDGSGEAADLVCLKDVDDTTIRLCLVHCKGPHEGRVSQKIRKFGHSQFLCRLRPSTEEHHRKARRTYNALPGSKAAQRTLGTRGLQSIPQGRHKGPLIFQREVAPGETRVRDGSCPGGSVASITDDAFRLLATTQLYLLRPHRRSSASSSLLDFGTATHEYRSMSPILGLEDLNKRCALWRWRENTR